MYICTITYKLFLIEGAHGNCYYSTKDFARAREMHEHHKALASRAADDDHAVYCSLLDSNFVYL